MQEHTLEYSILLLIIGATIYILRHKVKNYFTSDTVNISQSDFARKVKNAYLSLLDLLYHNSNKKDLEEEIRYIATQRLDGRYIGGYTRESNEFDMLSFLLDYFYDVINYSESRNENFIPSLSRHSTIKELNDILESALQKNINRLIKKEYPDNLLITEDNVISEYQKDLYEHKIQLAFLNEQSDEYYILLHDISREESVKKAVKNIGFEYSKILN